MKKALPKLIFLEMNLTVFYLLEQFLVVNLITLNK